MLYRNNLMIRICTILTGIMLYALPCLAQSTGGTDFRLTFGANYPTEYDYTALNLQIRIAVGNKPANVTSTMSNFGITEKALPKNIVSICVIKD